MKKIFTLCIGLCVASSISAQVLDATDMGSIDTIMEDNALTDVANRYSSVQLSYFPEHATRLGFDSANNKLDSRTVERDAQALRALHIVQDSLKNIRRKRLSESKKTDFDVLQGLLALDIYQTNQNRIAWDPLVYSQAFAALYDLRMKDLTSRGTQDRDLTARINALPALAQQAEKTLGTPPSFLAQLAMEEAYYAYLSFDALSQYLTDKSQDEISANQLKADMHNAKKAIKDMFDLFKRLAQENPEQDFRLGEKYYLTILQNRYFIEKPKSVSKLLVKNLRTAERQLTEALEPYAEAVLEPDPSEVAPQDIAVSDSELEDGEAVEVQTIEPKKPVTSKKKKKVLPTSRFYTIADYLSDDIQEQDFISLLATEAKNLSKFFAQDNTLPTANITFNIKELPAYYAYQQPYLFLPSFGMQSYPTQDVFVRLPYGNATDKQEMLNRDFNLPTLKLLMAGQIVPGLAYRGAYHQRQNLSTFRKMYTIPTLRNGWVVYAQHLANERGYIVTDAEQLFLAWADYVRAVQALADFYLHTQKMDYTETMDWLVRDLGFKPEQAQDILKQIAANPGEAVSYIYGYNALKNLRNKYQKKFGKKFSLADFHAKVMSLGDIPPSRLEAEMENAYLIEKNHVTQALNTPFYMN